MKSSLICAAVACTLGIGAAALFAPAIARAESEKKTEKPAEAKPVNKFCAVEKDTEVDPTVTTVQDGKVIGFCCADCIPKFKKDPAKYMKDLK